MEKDYNLSACFWYQCHYNDLILVHIYIELAILYLPYLTILATVIFIIYDCNLFVT